VRGGFKIQDSRFQDSKIQDSGFKIQDSKSQESRFQELRIEIPRIKNRDSGFQTSGSEDSEMGLETLECRSLES